MTVEKMVSAPTKGRGGLCQFRMWNHVSFVCPRSPNRAISDSSRRRRRRGSCCRRRSELADYPAKMRAMQAKKGMSRSTTLFNSNTLFNSITLLNGITFANLIALCGLNLPLRRNHPLQLQNFPIAPTNMRRSNVIEGSQAVGGAAEMGLFANTRKERSLD